MPLTDNVIGFWDLDTDSGDRSGNGNNGTDTLMSYDGTYGVFSGAGYIDLPTAMLGINVPLTWSCWFLTPSSGYYTGWSLSSGNEHDGVGCHIATAENLVYSAYSRSSAGPIATATLYHVVTTWDGTASNTVTLYLNGVVHAPDLASIAVMVDSAAFIGKAHGGWGNMIGSIRCVGLSSDIKDQSWVTTVYNGGVPMKWSDMAGGGGISGTFFNSAGPGTITLTGAAETVPVAGGRGTVTVTGSAGTFHADNGVGYFVVG